MTHPYYTERADDILRDFQESLELCRPHFEAELDYLKIEDLQADLVVQFHDVLADLPWVGGDDGRMTGYFEKNVGVIALGRVMISKGVPQPIVQRLLQRVFLAKLGEMEEAERITLGSAFMSKEHVAQLRTLAEKSREKENAGDFVYTFVEAGVDENGEPFDFGLDYHECGFCKLCGHTGDTDVLPMICAMDDESYGLRGVKLTRTQTLESGASHCNFRYSILPDSRK